MSMRPSLQRKSNFSDYEYEMLTLIGQRIITQRGPRILNQQPHGNGGELDTALDD
jgi:hypothetical protein